jgi:hypothetical protein
MRMDAELSEATKAEPERLELLLVATDEPTVTLQSSIWTRESRSWRMCFHPGTRELAGGGQRYRATFRAG